MFVALGLATTISLSSKAIANAEKDSKMLSATGIYPEPQGMAYIVKPDGQGSFEVIANMLPEDWSQLN